MKNNTLFYKARWIYPVASPPIENGGIVVSQGKIAFVGEARKVQAETNTKPINLGEGVILPALINAHTHLDLSVLKGRLEPRLGFLEWVKRLLALRESITDNERLVGLKKAIKELHQYGTVAVGDWIGSLGSDSSIQSNGLVRYPFFEVIGFSETTLSLPETPGVIFELQAPGSPGIASQSSIHWFSLGAHAPHTTSSALLTAAKAWTTAHRLPLSIHVAESIEEEEFLFTGQGPWREFLLERGKWPSQWKAPAQTPVAYLDSLGIFDEKTQCIHLTRAGTKDLQLLKERQVRIVVCPRSNQFISGSLPRLSEMLQIGLAPAIGTDSLASNHDLSLWEEMAFIHQAFPEIDPEHILQMATLNGARSIDLEEKWGSLSPGKKAGMLFLPLAGCSAKELSEAIIDSRGKDFLWIDAEG